MPGTQKVFLSALLPAQLTLGVTKRFISEVVSPLREPMAANVAFDFSALQFIDGAGLTALCNVIEWLGQRSVTVSFVGYEKYGHAIRYLDDCGFFNRYLGHDLREGAAARDTSLPAQPVQHAESFGWIETVAGPWMADQLGVSASSLAGVRTCIKELFNNINDHSQQRTGFVHVQLYPNANKFCLTVSDFGVGIPVTMKKFACRNDAEAIDKALEEGVTTKEGGRVAGAGLAYLARYVALANKGNITIYSGNGSLYVRGAKNRLLRTARPSAVFFPGTLFNLEFRTDTILAESDEPEDFKWES